LSAPAQQEKDMGLRSLDGYFRHYVGVVRWVDAFELDDYTKKIVRVDQPFPGVADGGCGFWRIWFDVAKGQLSAIDCNGEA
jgi:hypothetical protein